MIVKQRVEERARHFGYKEANSHEAVIIATRLLQESKPSFKVPVWIGLSHECIYSFLSQQGNSQGESFDALYQEFCRLQTSEHSKNRSLNPKAIEALKKIREFVLNAFSSEIHEVDPQLLSNIQHLKKLMVRSSGKEDNHKIANPGGNDSVSNVDNHPRAISIAIGKVVASYFSEKSLIQRLLSRDDITSPPFMPVFLQEMIGISASDDHCVRSGVMYVLESGTKIQIAPGHGELIVNSKAAFDSLLVSTRLVVYSDPQEKPYRMVPSERGLTLVRNKADLRFTPSVSESVILRLAIIGQEFKNHYGDERDIELVYDPLSDDIYIVQSRPLQLSEKNGLLPSSVPPYKLPEVKRNALAISKGVVITPAENAAMIITNKNQMIEHENIVGALFRFEHELTSEERDQIKAVIVHQEAPPTGHEAAQFKACSIPVLVLEDASFMTKVCQNLTEAVIIVDPQRSQVFSWKKPLLQLAAIEEVLFDQEQGILCHGLFQSSLPPRQFVSPINASKQSLFQLRGLFDKIQHVKILSLAVSELIEIIEGAQGQKDNRSQFTALYSLLAKLLKHRNKMAIMPEILHKALLSGWDIEQKIQEISGCHDEVLLKSHQQGLLDLTCKLSGLIYYPGKRGVLSSSVSQVFSRQKLEEKVREIIRQELVKKTPAQKSYNLIRLIRHPERFSILVDTLKFRTLGANEFVREHWDSFVISISQYPQHARTLAKLIAMLEDHGLSAEWLNKLFVANLDVSCVITLKKLVTLSNQFLQEIDSLPLNEAEQIIREWECKQSEWADPQKFNSLFSNFQQCLCLIDTLSLDISWHEFTQIKLLNLVRRLTNVIDESIKALKGSPKYAAEDTVIQRARNMVVMLAPLEKLMLKWVGYQPDNLQSKTSKADILREISERFSELSLSINDIAFTQKGARAMTVSYPRFRVASAVYRGVFSFPSEEDSYFSWSYRDYRDKLTLEDIYTLMHQNVLVSLEKLTPVIPEMLRSITPLPLLWFADIFRETKHKASYLDCGKVSCRGPSFKNQEVWFDFHCTLGKHHYKMKINYHHEYKTISLNFKLVDGGGGNEHGRYSDISKMMHLMLRHLSSNTPNFKILIDGTKYIRGSSLHFTIEFPAEEFTQSKISLLYSSISKIADRTVWAQRVNGTFFLPEEYRLSSHDLFYFNEPGVHQSILSEIAYKIKQSVNDRNAEGRSIIFILMDNDSHYDESKIVDLMTCPSFDLHQRDINGESLIDRCRRSEPYDRHHFLSQLIITAIHHSDDKVFQELLSEIDKKKFIDEFFKGLSEFMRRIFGSADEWHPGYIEWKFNFTLNLLKNHKALLTLLDVSQHKKITQEVGYFLKYAMKVNNLEALQVILNSPLCTRDSFYLRNSPYHSSLWAAAKNELHLTLLMESGKIKASLIRHVLHQVSKAEKKSEDHEECCQRLQRRLSHVNQDPMAHELKDIGEVPSESKKLI